MSEQGEKTAQDRPPMVVTVMRVRNGFTLAYENGHREPGMIGPMVSEVAETPLSLQKIITRWASQHDSLASLPAPPEPTS